MVTVYQIVTGNTFEKYMNTQLYKIKDNQKKILITN